MERRLVITIDGPSGVGKSTASKLLAVRLSYAYLDTGAIYRALACKLLEEDIALENAGALDAFLEKIWVRIEHKEGQQRVAINGDDVTDRIRTEAISLHASKASAIPRVREALLVIQRQAGSRGGIVAEGRDMGTVVFPNAEVKFFLDASPEVRARRRYEELVAKGLEVNYDELLQGMAQRDRQDRERHASPLRAHPDAVVIDSGSLSAEAVVERMMAVVADRLACIGAARGLP
jgi:cytidylate kinase